MGASESSLLGSQFNFGKNPDDGITTVSERTQDVDPILERLQSLKITTPILTSAPTESSLTEILVRKPSSSSTSEIFSRPQGSFRTRVSPRCNVNPNVLLELFAMYRDWQEKKAQKIIHRQEDIENKIEVADALAVKLLQRFNYSVAAMKSTSCHLSEVHALQVDLGELKGRLTEVISNCDSLCKRIATEGPESLQSSIKPFKVASIDEKTSSVSSSMQLPAQESNQLPQQDS